MEIHSSSLRSLPSKLGVSQAQKIASVQNNVTQKEANDHQNRASSDATQAPEQIQDALEQAGLDFSTELRVVDVMNKPMNSRIQQALHAYHDLHTQTLQNQRADLISGIDLYV